jgi:hypothetical protein
MKELSEGRKADSFTLKTEGKGTGSENGCGEKLLDINSFNLL